MMKKILSILLSGALALSLAACGAASSSSAASEAVSASVSAAESVENVADEALPAGDNMATMRVAGLKGPTTMGLVNLISAAEQGEAAGNYAFSMYGAADEIVPLLVKGELDAAAIPANLAATLYQKTEGNIEVLCVNTLGVLYVVEQGETVSTVADLKGRTILSTGKGTTPEYVLRYLLAQNGLNPDTDVTISYYSEAAEVSAQMAVQADAVAVLPQPYVTAMQVSAAANADVPSVRVALDLTAEWDKVAPNSLVTGVTVVRKAFAEENPDAVSAFLSDYADSVEQVSANLEGTAALCEQYEVVAKAAIAQKALPACNIVFVTGAQMQADVSGYLQVLFDADPASVGGTLPDDSFYYQS